MNRGDPRLVSTWRAKVVELSEGELFKMLGEVLTAVVADAPTPNPDDKQAAGFWAMLTALRDETAARYARSPIGSQVPRGSA